MTPGGQAERERRWQEYLQRQRDSECATLTWHWDGLYEVTHDGGAYHAKRADNGQVITHPDLYEFRELVRLDYCHKPVPRDATRD